jgi:hypothetical protein
MSASSQDLRKRVLDTVERGEGPLRQIARRSLVSLSVVTRLVPLPPSIPDTTPTEEMFSKVKGALWSAAARTTEAVSAAIGTALHDVFPEDIAGWFQSRAAYATQPRSALSISNGAGKTRWSICPRAILR